MRNLHLDRLSPLADLIEAYMLVPHGRRKTPPAKPRERIPYTQPPGYSLRRKLASIEKEIEYALARGVLIADLSQVTLNNLQAAWRGQRRKATVCRVLTDTYLALWRFAEECGVTVPGCPPRGPQWWERDGRVRLSEDEGTLWWICLKKYFPTNITIRSSKTKKQYRIALQKFKEFLGHDPVAADLTEDNVYGMMNQQTTNGLAPKTVNEIRARIRALWEWMARRRMTEDFPTLHKMTEPKRIPRAWSKEEIEKLAESCDMEGGRLGGVKARLWWSSLLYVLWDSGARIGEIMAARWEWVDWEHGRLDIPAEARKGKSQDMSYQLHADTLALLRQIEPKGGERELLFEWSLCGESLWLRFKKILKRAGLPTDRKSMFHRIRKSVASHVQAAGHDASLLLAHSSGEITRKSYLDPRIVANVAASAVLFRPSGDVKPEPKPAEKPADGSEEWL